jgi:cobalt-precorrin-5B (C1)-methyltransferase
MLRTGYTTGACAAAAARAAARAFWSGQPVTQISVDLPGKKGVTFQMTRCVMEPDRVTCGTIKDAGDDPDVTHGAEIQAMVEWADGPGLSIAGGPGVGRVTRPGLAVAVGEPAINPAPRAMILEAVMAEMGEHVGGRGIKVTISVPRGEELAARTSNPRLGIIGGISILGTTGIVYPYSQPAYRASIYVELKVARSSGLSWAALATGTRSAEFTSARYPDRPDLGMVQVGDHIGYALKQARRLGFARVAVAGMIGKISKLAQGRLDTHISEGSVDLNFLAELAGEMGADAAMMQRIRGANTAHHVQLLLCRAGWVGLEQRLAQRAAEQAGAFVSRAYDLDVLLYSLKGELLGFGHMDRAQ